MKKKTSTMRTKFVATNQRRKKRYRSINLTNNSPSIETKKKKKKKEEDTQKTTDFVFMVESDTVPVANLSVQIHDDKNTNVNK